MASVPRFEWSEECSVHIPQLDAQHREIIRLLKEALGCAHGPAGEPLPANTIDQLTKYADWHLRREELLLKIRGYPAYAEHRAEHDDYRVKVARLRTQLSRRDIGFRVVNFLSGWWRYHILTSDREYAEFFQRQKFGQ
jgi:hemerythrin